ncbi:sphingomyelin phosphodiesterase 1-like [Pararge aegeria]|uniref:sphingomyelin phosphodiesterase 1-like n=1 Tax=Pararge aegeria TaxID=116150 RepID=UPI0019D0DB54|nr:sphingomyelin phosphodiesterase 1-like [Pararge aegeria]
MKVFFAALLILGSSFASRLINSECNVSCIFALILCAKKRLPLNCLNSDNKFASFLDELYKLFQTVAKSERSQEDLKTLQDVFQIYRSASNTIRRQDQRGRESLTCLICRSGIAAFFDLVLKGATDDTVIKSAEVMCRSLGFLKPESCRGVLELNVPIFTHIIKTTPEATPRTFCALVLQKDDDPNYCTIQDPRFNWTVNLPERHDITNVKVSNSRPSPLTIALITDVHIDPLYEPNGVADCDEPTCCRKGQISRTQTDVDKDTEEFITEDYISKFDEEKLLDLDIAKAVKYRKRRTREKRDTSPAGFWGDYRNCDTPYWAYDDVIKRIASAHRNVDVVYYMGDSIDHHVWETTYDLIKEINSYTIDVMRQEFGDNVTIIPTIGNHESQPTNQFAPITVKGDKLNTTWLYDSLARKWDFYLTEEAKASVRKLGAFSILIRPGLRAISVNTNVAYKLNWWLVYDPSDAKKHLDWLVEQLHEAELAGEKVHILAHIPPGVDDLTHTWTREYNRIVNRFSATIAAEFNGHTHSDEFKIFYSTEDGSPINVAWGAGSASTYTNYNLNYKIATFAPTTFEPLNIANYIYNLTEANLSPGNRPRWFQLYDVKNSFGLSDISAKSMDKLVKGMVTDKSFLLAMYSAFFSKLSDSQPYCDDECKIDKVCNTVITVLWEREKCEELRRLFFS